MKSDMFRPRNEIEDSFLSIAKVVLLLLNERKQTQEKYLNFSLSNQGKVSKVDHLFQLKDPGLLD